LDILEESLLQSFFVRKLSAAKSLCNHWLVQPCTNGWWKTSPSTWNFGPNWSTLQKRRHPIDICS